MNNDTSRKNTYDLVEKINKMKSGHKIISLL
jgi:hypothetical protein